VILLHHLTQEDNPLSEHMALVSLASYRPCICRSHQKGICFNSDWPDPEEDALYSKAPDEDTLIPSHGGILLSMELRKNINACRLNVAWRTDWLETTIVI
jgi:hypothetical protein